MGYCTYADYSDDLGYTASHSDGKHRNGAGDSLDSAPMAMVVRFKEWMAGEISHALYLNTLCESEGVVFPAPGPYILRLTSVLSKRFKHAFHPTIASFRLAALLLGGSGIKRWLATPRGRGR